LASQAAKPSVLSGETCPLSMMRFNKKYLGCGVSVAESIKVFTIKDYSDFAPQLT